MDLRRRLSLALPLLALTLALLGLFFLRSGGDNGSACASGNCQAWYCDQVIGGQCYQRNGDGSYSPTNPVGCVGNCSGGSGECSSGTCPNGKGYKCCAQSGRGGCGPILMGVRGSDCCGGNSKPTPRPTPTPTPPVCDGTRVNVTKPSGGYEQEPKHVIVVGQDPTVRGFDLKLDLRGGWAEKWELRSQQVCTRVVGAYPDACPSGPWRWTCAWTRIARYNDPLIKVEVTMRLHESTIAWIENDLAARYPGVHRTECQFAHVSVPPIRGKGVPVKRGRYGWKG